MAKVRQARRCRAHRTDGRPCKGWAIVGGFVCMAHGGAAIRARQAAYYRYFEQRARAAFEHDYARWQRERAAFYVDRVLVTARVLGIRPQDVTAWDVVIAHYEYGVPPLDDQAPKLRRDRRFTTPNPPAALQPRRRAASTSMNGAA